MTKFAIAEIDTDFLFFCGSIYGIFEVLRDFFLSKFIMTFSASVLLILHFWKPALEVGGIWSSVVLRICGVGPYPHS